MGKHYGGSPCDVLVTDGLLKFWVGNELLKTVARTSKGAVRSTGKLPLEAGRIDLNAHRASCSRLQPVVTDTKPGVSFRREVRAIRLTERQWRIYLAVWLVTFAGLAGILAGILVPGLLAKPAPAKLIGDFVMNPPVAAPSFSLVDQRGNLFSLSTEQGRVIALTFLDTQCQSLCPLQASLLGTVQSKLGKNAPLTLVVVSVRPEVDTPAAIAAFAGSHGMTGAFYWLKGPQAQLNAVWASYGISVQPGSGDLAHSSVIYLIDRRGYERVVFGDVPDAGWLVNDVKLLQQS